jgi:hypothetical protein
MSRKLGVAKLSDLLAENRELKVEISQLNELLGMQYEVDIMRNHSFELERKKMKEELETREHAATKKGAFWGLLLVALVVASVLAVATEMDAVNDVALFLSGALVAIVGVFGVVWVVMGLLAVTRWLKSVIPQQDSEGGSDNVVD